LVLLSLKFYIINDQDRILEKYLIKLYSQNSNSIKVFNVIDFSFKVVLIGPGAVGKTSILNRFVKNAFSDSYKLTLGVDFLVKGIELDSGNNAKLNIWDIGGQKRFDFMKRSFYKGAKGCLLVFDLTRAETYIEMREWLSDLHDSVGESIPFILIGNKADLIKDIGEIVERKDAKEFAKKENSIYLETSAKTGHNVEEAFEELTQIMIDAFKDNSASDS